MAPEDPNPHTQGASPRCSHSEGGAPAEETSLLPRDGPAPRAPPPAASSSRQRILEIACHLFSERGFGATHLREICRSAEVNVAAVCYHFHGKEQLYQAVVLEAARRLTRHGPQVAFGSALPPAQRLEALVESLFERLSGDDAWIAKLAAREILDPAGATPQVIHEGLRWDQELIEAAVRELNGPQADPGHVHLCAVSIFSQCIFFCLPEERLAQTFPGLRQYLPDRAHFARHIMRFSLQGLRHPPLALPTHG